jgi:hypothetical protein
MPTSRTRKPNADRASKSERRSLGGLMVALLVTNVWFFTQVLTYAQ